MVKKKTDRKQAKKQLNYMFISLIVVAAIVFGSVFTFATINYYNNKNQTIAESDKPAADHIKQLALGALKEKKYTQAQALFNTASKQYEYILENSDDQTIRDQAQNDLIDCKAQIWLIEHR